MDGRYRGYSEEAWSCRSRELSIVPRVEMIVLDTPDRAINLTFAQCLITRDGGVHLKAAIEAVGRTMVNTVNEKTRPKSKGKGKDDKEKETANQRSKVTIADVKHHISIILSVRVVKARYKSQSKECLMGPPVPIKVPDDALKNMITKWSLYDRLVAAIDAKDYATYVKSDSKVRHRNVKTKKCTPANNAGKKGWEQAGLYLVEGDSAATYVVTMISVQGGDNIGFLPMRGKGLNLTNASIKSIMGNDELNSMKKELGLREGLDYTLDENFRTLRYGYVMILADADDDGKHIIGLLINVFHCRWPSLLQRGYVMYYRTPIIRVSRGLQHFSFYTQNEYALWKAQTPDSDKWEPQYFKGLASSSDKHIKEDCMSPRIVYCFYDEHAPAALNLAFNGKLADQRKAWMANWKPNPELGVESMQEQPISLFINHEFVQYGIANTCRSIPRLMDGIKVSQRKVLWGMMLHWGVIKAKKDGTLTADKHATVQQLESGEDDEGQITDGQFRRKPVRPLKLKPSKVVILAGDIMKNTQYHHGDASLYDTIGRMAHGFVGSNNLPYLTNDSQIGSRWGGGKDGGSARYLFTALEWWVPFVYRAEDFCLMQQCEDEGQKIEPTTFYPIIPMILVNGTNGIGTGHSSQCVTHNPKDIMAWIRCKIYAQPLPKVSPWFRGFTGEVIVVERKGQLKRKLGGAPVVASDVMVVTNVTTNEITEVADAATVETIEQDITEKPADEGNTVEPDAIEASPPSVDETPVVDETIKLPRLSVVTKGRIKKLGAGHYVIDELPIGTWIQPYFEEVLQKFQESKELKDINNMSTKYAPCYEITNVTIEPTIKNFKLATYQSMTNMVFLNEDNTPVHYLNVNEILESLQPATCYL